MCGIAGFFGSERAPGGNDGIVRDMLSTILHRGPDEIGYYLNDHTALGSARLRIIDLATGAQPISDDSGRYWIAYNGEVYNYLELKRELQALGRRFRTDSDTEVVLQAWIEWGFDALARLNGGYAFCIYDGLERSLTLVRDRFGKRPLFYARDGSAWLFASEMKAFSAWPGWRFEWDAQVLRTLFTCWTPLPADACYRGVTQVLPGCCVTLQHGTATERRYWRANLDPQAFVGTPAQAEDRIRGLLADSVRLRLRSDVEVGTYLSGGIDSAIVTRLAQQQSDRPVHSFSVAFSSAEFDESAYQAELSQALGTRHHTLQIEAGDIARYFSVALMHGETPVFRTAFVPLFMLSAMVSDHGIKVVLTGEGADEAFLGYDLFKEAHLLAHWPAMSEAQRSAFIASMYPYLKHFSAANARFLLPVYQRQAEQAEHWSLAHGLRFANSALAARLLKTGSIDAERFRLHLQAQHPGFFDWPPVRRAQMMELESLLSGYLLSTQGDRAALGHGVENRCPFLDDRVLEFAASLPLEMRLAQGLKEKQILKHAFAGMLPQSISARAKQPYRAPDAVAFLTEAARSDEIDTALSAAELGKIDVLDGATCARFVELMRNKPQDKISQAENQAFVLLLSLSLLDQAFVRRGQNFSRPIARSLPCTVFDRRSAAGPAVGP